MSTPPLSRLWTVVCLLFCTMVLVPGQVARAIEAPMAAPKADKNFTILAATFPVWLFTRNVCRDVSGVRVELFVPAQTGCPHDFTPSPADLHKLTTARAIVINGLGLEAFLARPLHALDRKPIVIDASLGTSPLPVLLPANESGDAHSTPSANPHIFAGPAQAAHMARAIGEGLAQCDTTHAAIYRANASAYADHLEALAAELAAIGKNALRTGIVLQHDDLAYLAHEAGLKTLAVLRTGDEQNTLSAARLNDLARRLAAEHPVLIASEPTASDRTVELLAAESGLPFALLDPVASGPADASLDYYERIMRANVQTLRRYFDAP